MKSLLAAFLIAIVVIGFSLAGLTRFGLAQDSATFKIFGYIVDSNGQGIAGAHIIFNVPDIVPSVNSNSSGYYAIFAPAGTYHVNVWPPFDSNYIYYGEPGFVVESNMNKNITLDSGYKVSGYITDSSGAPVIGASVWFRGSMKSFGSGWFSNSAGYYFLSVPAGTYTIDAHPRTANGAYHYLSFTTEFPTYYEYNFVVNSDTVKNITVGGTPPTPTPSFTSNVTNSDSNSWPMFHNDLAHSGYSGSTGPVTNQTLWNFQTGSSVESSPAVVDDVVYFGSQDQNIYALRASDGSEIWNYTTGSFVDTSPAVGGGIVYFGSRDGYVYALNATDGSQIWAFHSPRTPITGRSYYYSTPAVANGVIYVGSYDSSIYALNANNGNIFWEFRTGGYIFSSPVVAGATVYVGSYDGNVYALNAVTGSKIWSYQTGDKMRSSAAVANGVAYVGSGDGYMYAFGSPSAQATSTTTTSTFTVSSTKSTSSSTSPSSETQQTAPANPAPTQISDPTDASSPEGSVVNVNRRISDSTPWGLVVNAIAVGIIVTVLGLGCLAVWEIRKTHGRFKKRK